MSQLVNVEKKTKLKTLERSLHSPPLKNRRLQSGSCAKMDKEHEEQERNELEALMAENLIEQLLRPWWPSYRQRMLNSPRSLLKKMIS